MQIDRKTIDKSAILRGFRAMLGLDQRDAAQLTGLSLRTITNAESGQCSDKAYRMLLSVYASQGLRLAFLPALRDNVAPIIAIDCDTAGLIDDAPQH